MGIEAVTNNEETLEEEQTNEILATRESLSTLQENVEDTPITSRDGFCSFLKVHGVDNDEYPLNTESGKFLRAFRYYTELNTAATNKKIPLDYFFALMLTEGAGSSTTINTADGGVGVLQIMPETFKRFCNTLWEKDKKKYAAYHEYKVFYDQDTYTSYKTKTNQEMANGLLFLRRQNNANITTLSKIDSRFDPAISINFAAEYLSYCKSKVPASAKKHSKREYALNGYNKGPNNYNHDIDGLHLTNINKRKDVYTKFSAKIDAGITQNKTGKEILASMQVPSKTTFEKQIITEKKTSESISSTKKVITETVSGTLKALGPDKKKEYNIYTYVIGDLTPDQVKKTLFVGKDIFFANADGSKVADAIVLKLWKPTKIFYIKEKID